MGGRPNWRRPSSAAAAQGQLSHSVSAVLVARGPGHFNPPKTVYRQASQPASQIHARRISLKIKGRRWARGGDFLFQGGRNGVEAVSREFDRFLCWRKRRWLEHDKKGASGAWPSSSVLVVVVILAQAKRACLPGPSLRLHARSSATLSPHALSPLASLGYRSLVRQEQTNERRCVEKHSAHLH